MSSPWNSQPKPGPPGHSKIERSWRRCKERQQAAGLMNIVKPGVRENFFSVRSVDTGTACLKR